MAWYRARQTQGRAQLHELRHRENAAREGPIEVVTRKVPAMPLVQRMRGSHGRAGIQKGHRSERRDARGHRAVHPLVLDGAANAIMMRKPRGDALAGAQRRRISGRTSG
jgi:hypothetical protein